MKQGEPLIIVFFLLQDEEDIGEVVLVACGLVAVVRLEEEAIPTEEGVHGGPTKVVAHHGLHDGSDSARRLGGQPLGKNIIVVLIFADDEVASGSLEEVHGPDGEGAFVFDGTEEVLGAGAVVWCVECVDLLLVYESGGGHVHEGVGEEVPQVAVVGGGAGCPPGDEGGEDEASGPHLRRAAAEEGREVGVELSGVRVQHRLRRPVLAGGDVDPSPVEIVIVRKRRWPG